VISDQNVREVANMHLQMMSQGTFNDVGSLILMECPPAEEGQKATAPVQSEGIQACMQELGSMAIGDQTITESPNATFVMGNHRAHITENEGPSAEDAPMQPSGASEGGSQQQMATEVLQTEQSQNESSLTI
jgi:hypothetical protein